MNAKIGLWIDHRKAVIAVVSGGKEKVNVIESKVDKQLGRYDGVRSTARFDRVQVQADDSQDRGFMNQINKYYDKVIALIRNAESILIFGPGEAKVELKKRLEKNNLAGRVAAVETADKMTDHQVEAKVRGYFHAKVSPSRKAVAEVAEAVPAADVSRKRESRPASMEIKEGAGKVTVAKPKVLTALPVPKIKPEPSLEEVARLAYFIYLSEGCPQGRELEHWLKAEAQLKNAD